MEATVERTELEENFAKAKAVADALGGKPCVTIEQGIRHYGHWVDDVPQAFWTVTIVNTAKGNQSASGQTFEAAMERLVGAFNATPTLCPTCGGRMEGPCAHKH